MGTKHKSFEEGVVFLVPLPDAGFARGVLARTSGIGTSFGYFFGPRLKDQSVATLEGLSPKKAILVARFGDYGLRNGLWQVIGKIDEWDRSFWSLPKFSREHDDPRRRYLVVYDDKLDFVSETVVPSITPELKGLPDDSMIGSANIERKLGKLLHGSVSAD